MDGGSEPFIPVRTARTILHTVGAGALATLDAQARPFASLVTVAPTPAGEALFLLSELALHTKNLKRDPHVSLLLVGAGGEAGDPLAGARLTLSGEIVREDGHPEHHRRFLSYHPEAAGYADFKDFAFYRLELGAGHLVAGFGRIIALRRDELVADVATSEPVIEGEDGIVAHMNQDHTDAIELYATRLLGRPAGAWRALGCDPEGLDLALGEARSRLWFPSPVRTLGDVRKALKDLADEARRR